MVLTAFCVLMLVNLVVTACQKLFFDSDDADREGATLTTYVEGLAPPAANCEPKDASAGTDATGTADGATTTPERWGEVWQLETDLDVRHGGSSWDAYVCGEYLVVASEGEGGHDILTGYRLGEDAPEKIWYRETKENAGNRIGGERLPWWGGRLVMGGRLLDPATGTTTEASWTEGYVTPSVVSDDLVIVCEFFASEGTPCQAWDWNDGTPTERWDSRVDASDVTLIHAGIVGAPATGAITVRLERMGSDDEIGIMSLTDGSVRNLGSLKDFEEEQIAYLSARDGWIHIKADDGQAEVLSVTGEVIETFPLTGTRPALLLSEDGAPTVAQYRAAFESGDTSWARTVMECSDDRQCTVKGGEPMGAIGMFSYTNEFGDGVFQNTWSFESDGRTLVIREPGWDPAAGALVVDADTGVVLGPQDLDGYGVDNYVCGPRLLMKADGSTVMGYAPGGRTPTATPTGT